MALKLRISFYALENGKEINHVNGTAMVNNLDNALQKMQDFAKKYHPEASDVDLLLNERYDSIGLWTVGAQSNVNTDMYFLFVITRLT